MHMYARVRESSQKVRENTRRIRESSRQDTHEYARVRDEYAKVHDEIRMNTRAVRDIYTDMPSNTQEFADGSHQIHMVLRRLSVNWALYITHTEEGCHRDEYANVLLGCQRTLAACPVCSKRC